METGTDAERQESARETFEEFGSLKLMLKTAFPDEPLVQPAPAGEPTDATETGESAVLDGLVGLLRDDDAASQKYLEEHTAALRDILGGGLYSSVEQAVSRFELEEALQILKDAGRLRD